MNEQRPEREPRRSLTVAQRRTEAGIELLSLCQSITKDGRIDALELAHLKQWLEDHQSTDFGAIGYLTRTVTRILSDGTVTDEEYDELYRAVEVVLPPELRGIAKANRKQQDAQDKLKRKAELEALRAAKRAETERNAPIANFDFMVAGVRHDGRADIISDNVNDGDQISFYRDRNNAYSRNAVKVLIEDGQCIGFVPERDAIELAPLLDGGSKYEAYVKKVLGSGRVPIPVVVAYIYPPASDAHSTLVTSVTSSEGVTATHPMSWMVYVLVPAGVLALAAVLFFR